MPALMTQQSVVLDERAKHLPTPDQSYQRWLEFVERWRGCQECPLCTQRDKIVLARGVVPCDVLFIGEAPGVSEDSSGLPFDGPAGCILDAIVAAVRASTKATFTDAYTNLVCCFPLEAKKTTDHRPDEEEIKECSPRLQEFVEIAMPRLIVTVGTLSDDWSPITAGAGGLPYDVAWATVVHPASITRMPAAQKDMAIRKCVVVIRDAIERVMS